MKRSVLAAVAAATILSSGGAMAGSIAELLDVRGTVLVDKGRGFAEVTKPVKLKAGDKVVVQADGSALISYGLNCNLPLAADTMTTISETSCVVGTQSGPFAALERFRPLTWGILAGIATFIGAVI